MKVEFQCSISVYRQLRQMIMAEAIMNQRGPAKLRRVQRRQSPKRLRSSRRIEATGDARLPTDRYRGKSWEEL